MKHLGMIGDFLAHLEVWELVDLGKMGFDSLLDPTGGPNAAPCTPVRPCEIDTAARQCEFAGLWAGPPVDKREQVLLDIMAGDCVDGWLVLLKETARDAVIGDDGIWVEILG